MIRLTAGFLLALGAGPTCTGPGAPKAPVAVGIAGSSSEPTPGFLRPVAPADLPGATVRGQLLHDMQRALAVGHEGAARAGSPGSDLVLPIVQIDPGALSGQVVFVRWKDEDVPDAKTLDPAKAERWVLVALNLRPDQIIDVEPLSGFVTPGTREGDTVAALSAARTALLRDAPGTAFAMHPVFEEREVVEKSVTRLEGQVRVYAFGAEADDPDFEVLVRPGRKRKPPVVSSITRIHGPSTRAEFWIRTQLPHIGPVTVARVLARGPEAGEFEVETTSGIGRVDGATGKISAPRKK